MDAMGNDFGHFVGGFGGSPNTTVVHICQVTSWKSTWGTLWKQPGRSETLQGYGLHWITTRIIQNNLRMSRLSRLTWTNFHHVEPTWKIYKKCVDFTEPPTKTKNHLKHIHLERKPSKMGIKHLSDFKIHQPEPRHLFGVESLSFSLFADSRIPDPN